ncbi:MAG: sugar isomerase, partial [Saprospiraceae bacterium]|nr:sugar isomerase [Saprospiraceae bacterium]
MKITQEQITTLNAERISAHQSEFHFLKQKLSDKGVDVDEVLLQVQNFQVAIPSWALGAGGTRFGRFSFGGEPSDLREKINDVGLIHALTQ